MLGRGTRSRWHAATGRRCDRNYIGLYVQDNWPPVSERDAECRAQMGPVPAGLQRTGEITHFERARFDAGLHSAVFPNAPAGSSSRVTTDAGKSVARQRSLELSRRASASSGIRRARGAETLRMAYGRLYDLPAFQTYTGLAQLSPWGNSIVLNNCPRAGTTLGRDAWRRSDS
jgi:hypothetical protein